MNADTQRALAEHKARVDAKYSQAGARTLNKLEKIAADDAELRRNDRWLLVNADGQIVGVLSRHVAKSATEAFEEFYPKKKGRMAAAAEGYRIEEDDKDGTRFNAYCEDVKAGRA
ncbi:conserved hypothetical protein [uncultured Mycobacterium sp.]|uniref:Uncharacterized protein n=1 Tax=uncultured Mycobacterium sp. TaxID=171292 RepID=A0A1Y5P5D3_9MYCO|nr:conserved hypothetical protein [uncultured Mycobacterium sp.]